jgi:hypothetical protein
MTSRYAVCCYVDNAQQVAVKREKSAVLLVTHRKAIYVKSRESGSVGLVKPGN